MVLGQRDCGVDIAVRLRCSWKDEEDAGFSVARLLRRYRGLLSKVMNDPDAALTVSVEEDEKFVDSYVDVLPGAYDAPA